jgi:TolB-like protein
MGRARTKLAVLPFWAISTSVGPDDPFAEGLTEETMARLAQHCAPVVGVVSRRALGTGLDDSSTLRHLRDALHVDYVVEGRVRRVANRVRITSQLVDAIDATHLWAEVYEDDCSDSLLAQQRVAQAIATAVATRLATAYVASASLTA